MSAPELSAVVRARIEKIYGEKGVILGKSGTRADIFKTYKDTQKLRSDFSSVKSNQVNILTRQSLDKLKVDLDNELQKSVFKTASTELMSLINFDDFVKTSFPAEAAKMQKSGQVRLVGVTTSKIIEKFLIYVGSIIDIQVLAAGKRDPLTDKTFLQYIQSSIQAGHLAGIFTAKVAAALGGAVNFTPGGTYRDFTINVDISDIKDQQEREQIENYLDFVDKTIKLLLDADFLSSNLTNEIAIFTEATKGALDNRPYFTLEMQITKINAEAGDILKNLGASLNSFIAAFPKGQIAAKSNVNIAFNRIIKDLEPLAKLIQTQANIISTTSPALADAIRDNAASLGDMALNARGSLSIKQYIAEVVKDVIKTGKNQTSLGTTKATSKNTIKDKSDMTSQLNKLIKETTAKVKKLKQTIQKSNSAVKIRSKRTNKKISATNILSLQQLLDAQLVDTVKRNMGNGSRRDVLNLRSGRFAESVRVNRLSEGREGTISAFYTYMRNPYDTFSQGGKQQYPRSRDPKLLISKSIRQVAEQLKITRLRAIST
jgi:hypothetical protein